TRAIIGTLTILFTRSTLIARFAVSRPVVLTAIFRAPLPWLPLFAGLLFSVAVETGNALVEQIVLIMVFFFDICCFLSGKLKRFVPFPVHGDDLEDTILMDGFQIGTVKLIGGIGHHARKDIRFEVVVV